MDDRTEGGGLHIHLDAAGGCAGDMFVAAMLSALPALSARVLGDAKAALPEGCAPRLETGTSGGIAATRLSLEGAPTPAHRTDYTALAARIAGAPLSPGTAEAAGAILTRLAEAEAEVHAIPVERVHFHELADWDSLMDVVAAGSIAAALEGRRWRRVGSSLGGGPGEDGARSPLPDSRRPRTARPPRRLKAFRGPRRRCGERVDARRALAILAPPRRFPPPGHGGTLKGGGAGAGTRELRRDGQRPAAPSSSRAPGRRWRRGGPSHLRRRRTYRQGRSPSPPTGCASVARTSSNVDARRALWKRRGGRRPSSASSPAPARRTPSGRLCLLEGRPRSACAYARERRLVLPRREDVLRGPVAQARRPAPTAALTAKGGERRSRRNGERSPPARARRARRKGRGNAPRKPKPIRGRQRPRRVTAEARALCRDGRSPVHGPLAVAVSRGVDSMLLMHAAHGALRPEPSPCTPWSPAVPGGRATGPRPPPPPPARAGRSASSDAGELADPTTYAQNPGEPLLLLQGEPPHGPHPRRHGPCHRLSGAQPRRPQRLSPPASTRSPQTTHGGRPPVRGGRHRQGGDLTRMARRRVGSTISPR